MLLVVHALDDVVAPHDQIADYFCKTCDMYFDKTFALCFVFAAQIFQLPGEYRIVKSLASIWIKIKQRHKNQR